MSIYPPNTTTPKSGSGNYLWNWLGSSLKKFGAALSPFIDIPQPAPIYRAKAYNFSPLLTIQTNVNINTVGTVTWTYTDQGEYEVSFPNGFLTDNTYVSISQLYPGGFLAPGTFVIKNVSSVLNTIYINHYNAAGALSNPVPGVSLYIEVI